MGYMIELKAFNQAGINHKHIDSDVLETALIMVMTGNLTLLLAILSKLSPFLSRFRAVYIPWNFASTQFISKLLPPCLPPFCLYTLPYLSVSYLDLLLVDNEKVAGKLAASIEGALEFHIHCFLRLLIHSISHELNSRCCFVFFYANNQKRCRKTIHGVSFTTTPTTTSSIAQPCTTSRSPDCSVLTSITRHSNSLASVSVCIFAICCNTANRTLLCRGSSAARRRLISTPGYTNGILPNFSILLIGLQPFALS